MGIKSKIMLGIGGLAVACGLVAGYSFLNKQPQVDEEYMKKLDVIVELRERYGRKDRLHSWKLYLDLPEVPIREQWNAEHSMPQIMPRIKYPGDKNYSLYSMNMNGTDLRLMMTPEEIGGSIEMRGLSRPSRSPDGRFVLLSVAYGFFTFNCVVYDLKDQKAFEIGNDRCLQFEWLDDGSAAYFAMGGEAWRFDAATKTAEMLMPEEGSYNEELDYDRFYGMRLSSDKQYLIRTVPYQEAEKNPDIGAYGVFKLPEMAYLGRSDYYTEECDNGLAHSIDRKYFTCTTTGSKANYYDLDNVQEVVGVAPQRWIIQDNRWFMPDNSHSVIRVRDQENTEIPALRYIYKVETGFDLAAALGFYLPKNLRDDFEQRDFREFFPPLPTPEVYEKAKQIMLDRVAKESGRS